MAGTPDPFLLGAQGKLLTAGGFAMMCQDKMFVRLEEGSTSDRLAIVNRIANIEEGYGNEIWRVSGIRAAALPDRRVRGAIESTSLQSRFVVTRSLRA